MQTLVEKTYE
ncbi:MAG: hypothetical protein EZS28_042914, partial [Streblomastix strix]